MPPDDAAVHMRLVARELGEFTEIQRRLRGALRRLLLRANNLAYRLRLPPGPAAANLLLFEKRAGVTWNLGVTAPRS